MARFHREAGAAAKLHHTNIVSVYAIGEQDGKSSLDTKAFFQGAYGRSSIFLQRLKEDPNWPPWIPLRRKAHSEKGKR